ncbi:hypothetical protein HU200_035198 [Digitaria exilis]|uniref:Uncharacterized protein n=1 Tax=Digitaria exilis TaxID=1010633 RepID=A0A835BIP4_9POAL|nr:hypothetical protein HU200_035198 [Digitaria exilis]
MGNSGGMLSHLLGADDCGRRQPDLGDQEECEGVGVAGERWVVLRLPWDPKLCIAESRRCVLRWLSPGTRHVMGLAQGQLFGDVCLFHSLGIESEYPGDEAEFDANFDYCQPVESEDGGDALWQDFPPIRCWHAAPPLRHDEPRCPAPPRTQQTGGSRLPFRPSGPCTKMPLAASSAMARRPRHDDTAGAMGARLWSWSCSLTLADVSGGTAPKQTHDVLVLRVERRRPVPPPPPSTRGAALNAMPREWRGDLPPLQQWRSTSSCFSAATSALLVSLCDGRLGLVVSPS